MAVQKTFTIKLDGTDKIITDLTTLNQTLDKAASTASIADLEHNLKTLEEAYKSLNRTEQESEIGKNLLKSIDTYKLELGTASRAIEERNKQVQNSLALDKTQEGSIEQLKLKIKQLSAEYEGLSKAEQKQADLGGSVLEKLQSYQLQLSMANDTLREQQKETDRMIALRETEKGSMEQLKLMIKQMSETYEEMSEEERKVSGDALLYRIELLKEKLSDLQGEASNHLSTYGTMGRALIAISEGFEDASGAVSSFSGILSSGSEILKLFGVENTQLTSALKNLEEVTKVLNTLQAFHTQLVQKDSIVMKAAAVAKKLYTAATQGSSLALNGFKAALISTGIGAIIVLLGTLIANFDDIKKYVSNSVPALNDMGDTMNELKSIVAGVGEAIVTYVLTPFRVVSAVVKSLMNNDIKGALAAGAKEVKKGFSVIENYERGYKEQSIKNAREAEIEKARLRAKELDNHIKDNESKNGSDWKYTEEGIKAYQEYFANCLLMYEQDSEDYKRVQREKWSFEHDLDQRKKNTPKGFSGPKKDPKEYEKDLQKLQDQANAIYTELDQKQVDHYKKMAAAVGNTESLDYMKYAAEIELNIQKKKHADEIREIAEHRAEMLEKYKKDDKKQKEINELFNIQELALKQKHGKEVMELKENQAKELSELDTKIKNAELKKEAEHYNKLLSVHDEGLKNLKKKSEEANKDIVIKGDLGLIDVDKTRENYSKAIAADKDYLAKLEESHNAKSLLFTQALIAAKDNADKEKEIKAQMSAESEKYEKESEAVNKRIEANTQKSTDAQLEYYKQLHAKMTELWGKINEGLTAAFTIAGSIMKQQIEEAKSKLQEVTKQYDAVVQKRKESQDKLKSLEEEAASASGGRAIVIQEQISRQMEANEELAIQEKDLAKQKEKQEKEIARKEKQAKKVELGQKFIEGIANTALAVIKALSLGPILGPIMATIIGAAGAVQTAIIARQISKLEDGGLLRGKRHSQGGMRIEGTNIEVEGDEFVVNRISTRKNLGLIDYINKQRRELSPTDLNHYFASYGKHNSVQQHTIKHMYEEGGQLTNLEVVDSATAPDNNKILEAISRINFQPVVSVVDIVNTQNSITQVKDIAGL